LFLRKHYLNTLKNANEPNPNGLARLHFVLSGHYPAHKYKGMGGAQEKYSRFASYFS